METIASPRRPATSSLRIGGHVSLGRKPEETVEAMRCAGFCCLQMHASSPRTWRIPEKDAESLAATGGVCSSAGFELYLHAIYLINLASGNEEIYEKSIRMLAWNLDVAVALGATAVTFHVGSHRGAGFEASRRAIATALERILDHAPAGTSLLLENSAGAGGCIGGSLSELAAILHDVGDPPNLGCCLDTAHVFANGCDLRSSDAVDSLLHEIDESIGFERLRLVHVNDSRAELGSRRDRHENIGAGHIGEVGFAELLSRPAILRLPLILETPNLERRSEELATLQRLVSAVQVAA